LIEDGLLKVSYVEYSGHGAGDDMAKFQAWFDVSPTLRLKTTSITDIGKYWSTPRRKGGPDEAQLLYESGRRTQDVLVIGQGQQLMGGVWLGDGVLETLKSPNWLLSSAVS
jgi:hypothetical protein